MSKAHQTFEDPFHWVSRAIRKIHSWWLKWTYPFVSVGRNFSAHHSCDLRRPVANYMKIGDNVILERNVRLDVPVIPETDDPVILLGERCVLGQRTTILATNRIEILSDTSFAASVLVTDHNHAFEDVNTPIWKQGGTKGGTVCIEEGCWVGFGAIIAANEAELVIGKISVIGANALVTRSIPPYSVVSGNPARVVKQYNPATGKWVLGSITPSPK